MTTPNIRHLPGAAADVAIRQGWDDTSLILHLLGYIEISMVGWRDGLTDYLQSVADEENGESDPRDALNAVERNKLDSMIHMAAGLTCPDTTDSNPEYTRGMAELIIDMMGWPMEYLDRVVGWIRADCCDSVSQDTPIEVVPTMSEAHRLVVARIESVYNLDDWLESVQVHAPGMWENDSGPAGWYAVANDDGIVAYFEKEADAFRFRLDYINRRLNP